MSRPLLCPAVVRFDHPDHPGVAYSPAYGDVYHSEAGAWAQAQQVFLTGNHLPERWQGRERFVILETGFGLGNNFLATWSAWRTDPARAKRLVFVSIEKHPLTLADLQQAHASCPQPELVAALCAAWPVATPDLHVLDLDDGQVQLCLAWGDIARWLPELVLTADALYLDGFAPACNAEMWNERVFKACARLTGPGSTAATWSVARAVRDGLSTAGFQVNRVAGFGPKRQGLQARRPLPDEPGYRSLPAPPAGRSAATRATDALVIGAGLAGAFAARGLARQGVAVTVLDAAAQPAAGASGNVAGLFHAVVHPQDGLHAQLLRAGALHATRTYLPWLTSPQASVIGQVNGLLRGESSARSVGELRRRLEELGLPADFVLGLDEYEAGAWSGVTQAGLAWCFHQAGWMSPPSVVRRALATPGVNPQLGRSVARLEHDHGAGLWQALDRNGQVLGSAPVVVVACAQAAIELLATWTDAATWPLHCHRGQVTHVPADLAQAWQMPAPNVPLASGGYLLNLPDALGGGRLCGATRQADDLDPTLRATDHHYNLAQVQGLTGWHCPAPNQVDTALLGGRVGWRLASADRLPIMGPVAASEDDPRWVGARRPEQVRHVPRMEGLYALTALGSRGLTTAPLLGDALAAWVTGAPQALPADLLDAVDPARFAARRARLKS